MIVLMSSANATSGRINEKLGAPDSKTNRTSKDMIEVFVEFKFSCIYKLTTSLKLQIKLNGIEISRRSFTK